MSPQLPIALGAGALSALLYATLLTGSFGAFILAYLAQLPLFLIGLWAGTTAALVACAAAVVVAAGIGGVFFGITFLAVNALPAAVVVRQALLSRADGAGGIEWYPPGMLVAWVTGMVMTAFLIIALLLAGTEGGLKGYVQDMLTASLKAVGPPPGEGMSVTKVADALASWFPGIVAISWLIMVAVNGVLAQGLAVRFGLNQRPSPDMATLDLPFWIVPAAALSGVAAVLPGLTGFIGGNLALILIVPFVFAGLAVVHAVARGWNHRTMLLILVYLLIFIFGWPVLIVALLGLIEPWVRLRERFSRPPPS